MAIEIKQNTIFSQEYDLNTMNSLLDQALGDVWSIVDYKASKDICCSIFDQTSNQMIVFSYFDDLKIQFHRKYNTGPMMQAWKAYFPIKEKRTTLGWSWMGGVRKNPPEQFQKVWLRPYRYDMNSAFSSVWMKYNAPDINNPLGPGDLEENQIGFRHAMVDNPTRCEMVEKVGEYAEYRFPICTDEQMKPIRTKYIMRYYKIKQKATENGDTEGRKKAKAYLNQVIGDLKNQDFFLYVWTITLSDREILKYEDENTIKINTDCIISLVPRYDLDMGDGIGQFKLEEGSGELTMFDGSKEFGVTIKHPGTPKELQPYEDPETGEITIERNYIYNKTEGRIERI